MMKTFFMTATGVIVLALASLFAQAQTPASELLHFSKSGLSFDYPADVKFEEKTSASGQQLVVTHAQNGAQIMVACRYDMIDTAEQLAKARQDVFDFFVDSMLKEFARQQAKVERAEKQIEVAGVQASGVRLRAVLEGEPGNAEIYWLVLGRRLVMLSIIGSDKELAAGASAWALVRSSLKVGEMPKPAVPAADVNAVMRAGTLEGSTYTNSYFGLKLTFPDGWEAQDDRTRQKIRDKGQELLRFDDSNKQARLDESVANTANLLTLFETPFIQPYRAKLICVVEKIPGGAPFTEVGYAASLKTALTEHSKIKYVLEKDVRTEMIDRVPFTVVDFTLNPDAAPSHQKYYAHLKNGYALCFILSYASKRQLSALKKILGGISLS